MRTFLLLCCLALAPALPASATVILTIDPGLVEVSVGEGFQVEIRADLSEPTLGFGLDLLLDPTALALSAAPEIGPAWDPVSGSDGDGLAGVAFPAGLSGDDILLATLSLVALRPGSHALGLATTPGDLTEGFPLDPTGFDTDVSFGSAVVQALPEPGLALLLAPLAVANLARLARRRT